MRKWFKLLLLLLILIIATLFIFIAYQAYKSVDSEDVYLIPKFSTHSKEDWEKQVQYGLPTDKDPSDDYLIKRTQYVISYNSERNVANWAAWEISKDCYGSIPRYSGKFVTDTSLPQQFCKVKHDDFENSGYDRGHLVRSKERTQTSDDNYSTFFLTNIYPQTADLNQGPWLNFEKFCEELACKKDKQLFLYAGGIFKRDGKFIHASCDIAVPDSCYKIVLVLDKTQPGNKVNGETQVIAVKFPNKSGIRNQQWSTYLTTVRNIELSTGYNFFSEVSPEIQNIIENKIFESK